MTKLYTTLWRSNIFRNLDRALYPSTKLMKNWSHTRVISCCWMWMDLANNNNYLISRKRPSHKPIAKPCFKCLTNQRLIGSLILRWLPQLKRKSISTKDARTTYSWRPTRRWRRESRNPPLSNTWRPGKSFRSSSSRMMMCGRSNLLCNSLVRWVKFGMLPACHFGRSRMRSLQLGQTVDSSKQLLIQCQFTQSRRKLDQLQH